MIALMQPCERVQLGNPPLIDRGQLLMISDNRLMLAHLIPAIVVSVCVTTMVGLSKMLMIRSSFLYMTGS